MMTRNEFINYLNNSVLAGNIVTEHSEVSKRAMVTYTLR